MHISAHIDEKLPLGAPSSPDARCQLDLDAAVSTLYRYGGHLRVGKRRSATTAEVMRILSGLSDEHLLGVASDVSHALHDVFRVSADFNRLLWVSPNGHGEAPHAPLQ